MQQKNKTATLELESNLIASIAVIIKINSII